MFSIEQDSYLTSRKINEYFSNDVANGIMTLFARNMSIFVPAMVYIHVLRPVSFASSQELTSDNSYNTSYDRYQELDFRFEKKIEEDDSDLLIAMHQNGYK